MEASGTFSEFGPGSEEMDAIKDDLEDNLEHLETTCDQEEIPIMDSLPIDALILDRIVILEQCYWIKPTTFLLVAYKPLREPDGRPKVLLCPRKKAYLKRLLNRCKTRRASIVECEISKLKLTHGIFYQTKARPPTTTKHMNYSSHEQYEGYLFGYSYGLYFKVPSESLSFQGQTGNSIQISNLEEQKFPLIHKSLLAVHTMKHKYYFFSTIDISVWDPAKPKDIFYLKRKFRPQFFSNAQIAPRNSIGRDIQKVDGKLLFIAKNLRLCLIDWPRLSPEPVETEIKFSDTSQGEDVVAFKEAWNHKSVFTIVENTAPSLSYRVVRFSLGNENTVKSKYSESSLLWLCHYKPDTSKEPTNPGKVLQEWSLGAIPSTQIVRGINLAPDSVLISSTLNSRVRRPTTKNYFHTYSYSGVYQSSLEWEVPNQEDQLAITVNPILSMKVIPYSKYISLALAWACAYSLILLFPDKDGSLQVLEHFESQFAHIRSVVVDRAFQAFSVFSLDNKRLSIVKHWLKY